MSPPFGTVMRDLNHLLQTTYQCASVALIPGSGTYGMEAVGRQFATDEHVLILRNGWFSYRWTEIFDLGNIPKSSTVLNARPVVVDDDTDTPERDDNHEPAPLLPQYAPCPIDEVVTTIYAERPKVLFCAHVETSTGMLLPDDYVRKIATAMHDVGGLLVVDCIASGTVWLDMAALGVDVVISAPQKGWTGPCCCAMIMLSELAKQTMDEQAPNKETSYSLSLRKWSTVMEKYEAEGYMYHTTMPTDALRDFHEISVETLHVGLPELKQAQHELGRKARDALEERDLVSVAAPGFQAPGVLVYYSPSQEVENVALMHAFQSPEAGSLQIAMGVPWALDEPAGLKTFRLGLFGLDKLQHIDQTVTTLTTAVDSVIRAIKSLSDTSTTATTTSSSSSLPKAA